MRRLKTTSVDLDKEIFKAITVSYMDNLCAMGYGLAWREKILHAAQTGYQRILDQETKGTSTRNVSGASTASQRRFNKLTGAANWYKLAEDPEEVCDGTNHGSLEGIRPRTGGKGKGDKYPESILFIPYTPGSTLKSRVAKL